MEGHVNTLRCCGKILCYHPQGVLGNLLLNGLSIPRKLCFFCVHTGWRPHGKARAAQGLVTVRESAQQCLSRPALCLPG